MMEAYVVILQITNTRMPTGFLVAFGPRRRQNEIVWIIGGGGRGKSTYPCGKTTGGPGACSPGKF